MCCFFTTLLNHPADSRASLGHSDLVCLCPPTSLVHSIISSGGFLGWLFLPWTTLMYISIYPGGITRFDWIFLGLGLFADIFT
jgi:hypothetical protein